MKPSRIIITAILLSVLASFVTVKLTTPKNASIEKQESAYDRVMRTGVLRCGYGIWEPLIIKDANTGKLSGIFVDYMAELSKALNIKIEFTEEIGWGDLITAVKNNRVDAICAGVWTTAARAREADFTNPIGYQSVNAYARTDDGRFDNNLNAINQPQIKIATIDGEMSSIIAKNDFSNAKTVDLPQTGTAAQMLLNVTTGKADVAFTDTDTAENFIAANPGKLKEVPGGKAVRSFPTAIMVKKGEFALESTINTASRELQDDGIIKRIFSKWKKYPGTIYEVVPSYTTDQEKK